MTGIGGWWRKVFARGDAGLEAIPAVPAGQVVYAIGDIHGELRLLEALLARITADSAHYTADHGVTVVFLGDYIDRGPDSRGVIDHLLGDPVPRASLRFLRGNHEDALLTFLERPDDAREWLRFGGAETLASYGLVASPATIDPARLRTLSEALRSRLPREHLAFLRSTEFLATIGDYAFVHAGIRPGVALDNQSPRDLMWIRQGFVDRAFPAPPVIVHGHTIVDEPEFLPCRIAIDTGAFATGVLTALRLHQTGRHVIQVRRDAP